MRDVSIEVVWDYYILNNKLSEEGRNVFVVLCRMLERTLLG